MQKFSILLVSAALLFSCKKDSKDQSKYCWKCMTSVSYSPSSLGGTSSSTTTICDQTQDQINSYQNAGSSTTSASSGGITVTVKTATTCSKQ